MNLILGLDGLAIKMTRPNSPVTESIIKKIHLLLSDVETGEDIIDFLRSTEPVFMREVGEFVQIELDKLKKEFDEEFLLYLGSVVGAAYIMGFLIAREVDHKLYDGLLKLDSPLLESLNIKDIDKIIDDNLEKGKKPKEIGNIIQGYFAEGKKRGKCKKSTPKRMPKINKKKNKLDIDFDEGEL